MTLFTIKNKKIIFSLPISILLSLLSSIGVTFLLFIIAPGSFQEFMKHIMAQPSLFFINFLPCLLLIVFLWFLTNHCIFSIVASSSFFVFLGIANRLKIILRQDPLVPTDLTLFREATTIVHTFDTSFLSFLVIIIVGIILSIAISIFFFGSVPLKSTYRISGCIIALILGFVSNTFLYSNESLYNKYSVTGNIYFQVNHYNSKGLTYSFLHSFNTQKVNRPEGYSAKTYKKTEQDSAIVPTKTKKPHIIMIMGEAFSDLSINENIDFSNYNDPLKNFKALYENDSAVSGHIVVPGFGGGTSNTEYDVLTGCPTRFLDNSLPSYNFVRANFDALPRRLEKIGYDTLAIHPGYSWFYNRLNVYNHFGFNQFITLDSFEPQKQSKGGYISEVVTMDTIINSFEEHIEKSDNPLFSFTVTIQNHGPYENKYNDAKKNFDSPVPLTKQEENMLSNYFFGLKDVDDEIGRLVDYISDSEEPIVLVYFGDHLPGFKNGMEFFDILDYDIDINGTLEQRLRVYETPYVIWENEAAKEIAPITKNYKTANLPKNNLISSNYLGTTMLELLGLEGLSPLYDYSNSLRKELPVITNEIFYDGNSNYIESISKQQKEKIDYLKGWQYYKLFDETIED